MLTDFQNSFNDRLSGKFVIKSLTHSVVKNTASTPYKSCDMQGTASKTQTEIVVDAMRK